MSGYYNAAGNGNVLNYDRLQKNSAKVAAYCKNHKSDTLPTAIKKSTSEVINERHRGLALLINLISGTPTVLPSDTERAELATGTGRDAGAGIKFDRVVAVNW